MIELPVKFRCREVVALMDVVVGVANIAVTLAVNVVCVISVSVVIFGVDTEGMTVDVKFKVWVGLFAVGTVVVNAVAVVGGVTVVDKVALGSTFVVVYGVRVVSESVVVLILAVVALALTAVATVGVVTVGSVSAFTNVKIVDSNEVTDAGIAVVEPEETVLLSVNKTRPCPYHITISLSLLQSINKFSSIRSMSITFRHNELTINSLETTMR